jgi:hypothetical protein
MNQFLSYALFWNPYGVVIRMVKESEKLDEKYGNESSFCARHSLKYVLIDVTDSTVPPSLPLSLFSPPRIRTMKSLP